MTVEQSKGAVANWFAATSRQVQDQTLRTQGSGLQLRDRFSSLAQRLNEAAVAVVQTRTLAEHKPVPPIDVTGAIARLESQGVQALTLRERRALASQPALVRPEHMGQLLKNAPGLARHLARACLSDWGSFCSADWGAEHLPLLLRFAEDSGIALLRGDFGDPKDLLRRGSTSGTVTLAESLAGAPLERAHEYLNQTLGLRDTWLYTAEVLASWLRRRNVHDLPLDDAFQRIRSTPVLRTMLLPAVSSEPAASGVRADEKVHAGAVAALLDGAYRAPAMLSSSSLAELSSLLMRSSFGDPRLPPLSAGWAEVRRHAQVSFARFMTSLAEQDLEVFFTNAMNEEDRRQFWLSYLPQIERTGCVLDAGLRDALQKKLSGDENLRAAVQRTHRFRRASSAQAFYLVFSQHVVVEFSESGNAAYVYPRDYFESEIERSIRSRSIDSVVDLKRKSRVAYRISHMGSWQAKTAQWLSSVGIHSKRRW